MKTPSILSLLLALAPTLAFSHNLSVGQTTPSVSIDTYGEMTLQGDDVAYQPWATQQMLGKVRVIQAIAGRSKAKEMNAPLMSAITAAHFPEDQYQTTTVINQEDAIWGTGTFVKSSAEDSKKTFSWSSMVLDKNGVLATTWDLQQESSAIIVQNKQGEILFVKEGALTQDEVTHVIELIKQNI
ncbi:YtfJ family protein [Vibrio parahaemolyticus]|uniref:YtfJ family protein n=1 Tax=Vibrio TaxID=662 RepID=UPI000A36A662|nr:MULTISPECIES: YtfJ family protein [Vibrio]EHR6002294.1 YtfJ family protein [Vibrio parahaemolyticus]MBS9990934.1 YtfJ family protein [Vibrio alginolyticus]MDW1626483.1 YtfJ family protein [Vibrio sp. Y176]OUJ52636.1 hypothetical protein BTO03_24600 [Vibrio parahaemolyticus]TOA39137.1 YtfJ family protein [Vibrio parahaemolyticus]